MKLLITGAKSQIGLELAKQATEKKLQIFSFDHKELDITQSDQIADSLVKLKPTIVINTAAYTAVDKAEEESKLAFASNCEGPRLLAQICAEKNIPLIHLSTDYVFSGEKNTPYLENDMVNPLNVYGQSKLVGEEAIRQHWDKHIILRLSGIFSSQGQNFVKTILRLANEKEELRIVNDQVTCPTSAADIAEAILFCYENLANTSWGTYHFCSLEPTSWFHFTETILQQAAKYQFFKVKRLIGISSEQYKTAAKRPAYSVLDCHKIQSNLNCTLPSWPISLNKVLQELHSKR